MFKTVCIRPTNDPIYKSQIDIGEVIESLIFYKRVIIPVSYTAYKDLLNGLGFEFLSQLIQEGHLHIEYMPNQMGMMTNTNNTGAQTHGPVLFSSENQTLENASITILQEITGKSGKGRRLGNRLKELIKEEEILPSLLDSVRSEFLNKDFVEKALREAIKQECPSYPSLENLKFNISGSGDKFIFESNLDLSLANTIYHQTISPKNSSISHAHLMNKLVEQKLHFHLASKFDAELRLGKLDSEIMKLNFSDLIQRTLNKQETIKSFSDFTLDNSNAIRESIHNGSKTPIDFLPIIKKSTEFKEWIIKQDDNADLIKEYYKSVTKDSFIDKLPSKTMRFCLFTGGGLLIDSLGAGGLGTMGGVALNALDTFVLDKVLKGWKPNQFVENELKKELYKK